MIQRSTLVGVDGCKLEKWIAIGAPADGDGLKVELLSSAAEVLERFPSPAIIAVDIPIGLTDSGRRAADEGARALLKAPRASSVFPAPIRPILNARAREEASRLHRAVDGRGFGAQAWAILPRIREWDRALQADEARAQEVFEVHPEVSFWALNGEHALAGSKKEPAGAAARRRLLEAAFGGDAVRRVLASEFRRGAADDDVLDAFVALWTAGRIARGDARSLPTPPQKDSAGLADGDLVLTSSSPGGCGRLSGRERRYVTYRSLPGSGSFAAKVRNPYIQDLPCSPN